jgi:hypothetical protein
VKASVAAVRGGSVTDSRATRAVEEAEATLEALDDVLEREQEQEDAATGRLRRWRLA